MVESLGSRVKVRQVSNYHGESGLLLLLFGNMFLQKLVVMLFIICIVTSRVTGPFRALCDLEFSESE